MTKNPSSPTPYQHDQLFGSTQPSEGKSTKASRAWFKKKRLLIPGGFLALFIVVGIAGGGGEDLAPAAGTLSQSTASPSAIETEDVTLAEATTSAEDAEKEAEVAAKAEAESGTMSQRNALRAAENYLSFTAFSRTGLIGQLEFEDYSTADATWAVDRVEVDWNEQAAKKAVDYLDYTAFSKQGLIDQLVFEGFSTEQAQYGVSQTGL